MDFIREGEESLIESTQALTLPPPASSLLRSFFSDMAIWPPSAANASGGENSADVDAATVTMPLRDEQSDTTTFCLVIFFLFNLAHR